MDGAASPSMLPVSTLCQVAVKVTAMGGRAKRCARWHKPECMFPSDRALVLILNDCVQDGRRLRAQHFALT